MDLAKLSNEELCVIFQKKSENSVFNELYTHNYKIIKDICKKFVELDNVLYTYSDYESEASIAFLKAVNTFDANKGMKFTTWVYPIIRNYLIRYVKPSRSIKNNGSKNKYNIISMNVAWKDGEFNLEDSCAYENERHALDNIMYQDTLDDYHEVLATLKESDRILLEELYKGRTQIEIAKDLNTTRQNVSAKVVRLKKLLRKELL